jgi:hypothetical protein
MKDERAPTVDSALTNSKTGEMQRKTGSAERHLAETALAGLFGRAWKNR